MSLRRRSGLHAIVALLGYHLLGCSAAGAAQQYTHPFDGYSLSYPNGWELTAPIEAGERVTVRSFPESNYGVHGCLPPAGVEIIVATIPPETNEYTELTAISNLSEDDNRRDLKWATQGPAEVAYTYDSLVDSRLRIVLLAPRKANKLFYMRLKYHASDPNGPNYERVLHNIAASLKVQLH